MDTLKDEVIVQDFLTRMTKVRWGRMGKETEEIKRYIEEEERGRMWC